MAYIIVMLKICDAHNDILFVAKSQKKFQEYFLEKVPSEAIKIFCAYFSYNKDKNVSVQDMQKRFSWVRSLDKQRAIPTIENCWFVTPENIDSITQTQPFCACLTHNLDNSLCGGALEYGSFSDWGKQVVNIFTRNNIIIDTAHMNKKSFWQFVDMTYAPIFNSHCGFERIFNHQRNLTGEQVRIIVQSGGFIGLALYPKFFTHNNLTVEKMVDIIFWFWGKFGTNTLGWGTDFNGIEQYPEKIRGYTDMQLIASELLKRGAKKSDIEKLFSKNLLNFMQKTKNSFEFLEKHTGRG